MCDALVRGPLYTVCTYACLVLCCFFCCCRKGCQGRVLSRRDIAKRALSSSTVYMLALLETTVDFFSPRAGPPSAAAATNSNRTLETNDQKITTRMVPRRRTISPCPPPWPGKGLELLSKMRKKRVRANSTCVNAAIHGFTLLGDWETALDILESMERVYQVVPDAVGAENVATADGRCSTQIRNVT